VFFVEVVGPFQALEQDALQGEDRGRLRMEVVAAGYELLVTRGPTRALQRHHAIPTVRVGRVANADDRMDQYAIAMASRPVSKVPSLKCRPSICSG
jgi:hypothetical protein